MTTLANRLAMIGLLLALGCVATILLAGLGYRFGWWPYGSGIATIAVVFWVAAGSALVCAVAAILSATRADARGALVMSLAGLLAWQSDSIADLFTFFLTFLGGVGPIYVLRWLWWRVRASTADRTPVRWRIAAPMRV